MHHCFNGRKMKRTAESLTARIHSGTSKVCLNPSVWILGLQLSIWKAGLWCWLSHLLPVTSPYCGAPGTSTPSVQQVLTASPPLLLKHTASTPVVLILCIFMAINMISSELAQWAIRFLKQQQHTSHRQAANVAGVKAGNLLGKKKYINK